MAVLIENKENVFFVKGEINHMNADVLKSFLKSQLYEFDEVILNINQVIKIDKVGMNALTSLYRISQRREKNFSIIGIGCKDVYDGFLMSV